MTSIPRTPRALQRIWFKREDFLLSRTKIVYLNIESVRRGTPNWTISTDPSSRAGTAKTSGQPREWIKLCSKIVLILATPTRSVSRSTRMPRGSLIVEQVETTEIDQGSPTSFQAQVAEPTKQGQQEQLMPPQAEKQARYKQWINIILIPKIKKRSS